MENARMSHSAAEFRLWQVIPWKLEYPLIETMFSQRQCNEIMGPILNAGIQWQGHPIIRACDSVRLVFRVKWKRGPIIKQLKVT